MTFNMIILIVLHCLLHIIYCYYDFFCLLILLSLLLSFIMQNAFECLLKQYIL